MAKYQIIATRDIVANVFSIPQFIAYMGHAIRSFQDECQKNEPGNVLSQHPEDFELWHLGEYEDDSGTAKWFPIEERKQIAVGANFRRQ